MQHEEFRDDSPQDIQPIDATHAAAHLPASEGAPESPEATEQGSPNGQLQGGTPLRPPGDGTTFDLTTPSSLIEPYPASAPFWHGKLEPNVFYETPLIVHQQLADAERIVLQMESYLRNTGYEVEANELRVNYTQWVKIPATQYEQLRHELEPLRLKYLNALQKTQEEIEQAQTAFVRAMAAAKIPFPESPKPKKRSKNPPPQEPISPELVERALKADFANDDEVCGEQGVAPMSSKGNVWVTVGQWIFEFVAPLAAGLLLGINLGVIVGLLSLEVIQRGEALWLVAVAAVIGLFVEKLVGNTAYALASSAAQASERRDTGEKAVPFPTMYSKLRVGFFILVIFILTIAIATVDALGLHMLYEERQRDIASGLGGGAESTPVPLWVFFIAGLIISAPYIIYKSVKGWREPEIRQREARITYLHWKHVELRREEPTVQDAFAKAREVQNLYDRRDWLSGELEHLEARLDAARTECIGSTQKFREYWEDLVAWLRSGRASDAHEPPRRNGVYRSRRAPNETLLHKLLNWFRR
ncbi:MAG: hypothetical protein CFK49_03310 [Armatimonadetes bacterium JP3_11]|jgi:hypothetical protein|nr:MAG: hypothetical protein CFK48_07900 [Armatimonadetes bacterium CP1_7O]OYT75422.1 MAG: hypothetical protein CFK49_03310 [Armatimonadetes bacterium JP3_11]